MRKVKPLAAIMVLALVMSLGAPQAFAGFIPTGVASGGTAESPGITGPQESPGATGEIGMPGVNGEIGTPGFNGWIGTGLAAIAALFG